MASARPIVTLSRRADFSAAHRLHSAQLSDEVNRHLYDKCNSPNGHGHNYKVEASVRGPVAPRTGMVMNLADLKRALDAVLALLDHKHIDKDVPHFAQGPVVSTTENVTVFIWEELRRELGSEACLLYSVTVHETDKNVFTYYGQTEGT